MPDKFIFNFNNNRSCQVNDEEIVLSNVRAYVTSGTSFELAIPIHSIKLIQDIESLIDLLGISIKLDPDSEPEAIDYLINSVYVGVLGGFQGAAFGGSLWLSIAGALAAAAKAGIVGIVIPPAAPYVIGGTVGGAVAGVAAGLAATRWRLKLSFKSSFIFYNADEFLFFKFQVQS